VALQSRGDAERLLKARRGEARAPSTPPLVSLRRGATLRIKAGIRAVSFNSSASKKKANSSDHPFFFQIDKKRRKANRGEARGPKRHDNHEYSYLPLSLSHLSHLFYAPFKPFTVPTFHGHGISYIPLTLASPLRPFLPTPPPGEGVGRKGPGCHATLARGPASGGQKGCWHKPSPNLFHPLVKSPRRSKVQVLGRKRCWGKKGRLFQASHGMGVGATTGGGGITFQSQWGGMGPIRLGRAECVVREVQNLHNR